MTSTLHNLKILSFPFFIILFLLPALSLAQINDCADAQVVCDDEHLAFNPMGPGLNDFADPDNIPGCITSLEQNSAWYYFQIDPNAPPNLVLGFIIHPLGGLGEDYDWALFGPNANCGDLGAPIRCSSSSAACGFCPETGMGMNTTDVTEGPGTGDGFVMTLVVQPGQGFYLLIDNWQGTNNGFILEWTDTAAEYLNCEASPPCALTADAGEDINGCEGTTFTLTGGSNGHGTETYSWSGTNGGTGFLNDPELQNPTVEIPPGFNGVIIYTLTVVEDTCMAEDDVEVTINPLPVVEINPIGPFCENNPPATLTATPLGGTWGGAATGNNFNPATNGPGIHTVTYTYMDANDCETTGEMEIEVYALPDVTIDPDPAEFCDNDGSLLLTATGSGGAGAFEYNWNTPTGMEEGNTYSATISGPHTIIVTDANGCTNTSVVNVMAHPNPEVEINDPGPICGSLEQFTLTATPSGGEFDGSIISPDGEILPNTVVPGTYTVNYSYFDSYGCEGTDVANITIIPKPNAFPENNGPLCAGQPILLFGMTDGTGSVITYLWNGPNGYMSTLQNPTNATEAGFYSLEVTVDNCPSSPAFTNVVLTSAPDAVAQNTGPYCNGETIQLLGSTTATGNIVYTWSGPNGYSSNLQNPTDATLPGTYTLVVSNGGTCTSPTVSTEVIFSPTPAAVASNTGPYCAGESMQLNGNTPNSGTVINYSWSGPNGYTSNVQNPSGILEPGLYQLIVNIDGCSSIPNSTNVIVNASPQPTISGQSSFCTGNSTTLDAGSGYTNYIWSNSTTSQTLIVNSSGTYHVTVTDNNSCTGSTSITVTETPSLSPVISGDLDFCEGGNTLLDAGSGFTSYEWSTGATSQTITVSTGGNIGVLVTDASGCSGSTVVTTIVNQNPTVTIGGSTTFCIGGSTVLDAGAGFASYVWNNNSTSQTITVSTPGVFSVDVIDNNGCAGSASVTIIESTSLSPVITGGNAFCENGNTSLNAGSGFATYEWSTGATTQNLFVNSAGTYSVTVTDGQSCSGESSVAVVEVQPPFAQLQTTASLCNTEAGGAVINLYDLILSGDANGTWEDSDQSGAVGLFDNLDFKNIPAGDYIFKYTTNSAIDPCPEETYDVIITVIDCSCPDILIMDPAPVCNSGGTIDLPTTVITDEPGTWILSTTPTGNNPATVTGNLFDATGGDPGIYGIIYSYDEQQPPGCDAEAQVIVQVDQEVTAGVSLQPATYCAGDDEVVALTDLITGEDLNGTWKETSVVPSQGTAFNASNGTFATKTQTAGTYTFEYAIESNNACPDAATEVTVVINPLPSVVIAPPDMLDCIHPDQTLDASGSAFGNNFTQVWSGPGIISGANTLEPVINKPGIYTLTIENIGSGCINTASITVLQNTDAPRTALITSKHPGCSGVNNGSISVDQVIGGTAPYEYSLNNQIYSSTDFFNNLSEGTYTLSVEDAIGCRWDTSITLIEPLPTTISLGPDIELEFGDSAIIQAIVNITPDEIDTVIWSPDNVVECFDIVCLEGTILTFKTINLKTTLIDKNGCEVSDDILIKIKNNRRIFIPTAFSPNDDGINDVFYIFGSERQIRSIKNFTIYNRWGDVLHEANNFLPNDPGMGWDGHFKNLKVNPGVFAYRAEIEYIDGIVEILTGDVTVVR